MSACGGICHNEYYHTQFPDYIMQRDLAICHLEMLNVSITISMWAQKWSNATIIIHCDNMVTVNTLQYGRSRDPFLLQCARHIWLLTAVHNISLTVHHIAGACLVVADALSRAHLSDTFKNRIQHLIDDPTTRRILVTENMFSLSQDI